MCATLLGDWEALDHRFPTFLTVTHVVVTPSHKIIFIGTAQLYVFYCTVNIFFAGYLICNPHERILRHRPPHTHKGVENDWYKQ